MADRDYDPEDLAAIAAYTRDELIEIQVDNELDLRRDYDHEYTESLIRGGFLGTNFMTTRELRDDEYDSLNVPEEDRKYQPDDGPEIPGEALTVAQILRALMVMVNERPELAHEVPLMWHVLDDDMSIGARVVKVEVESYNRVKLVGPKEEGPKPEPSPLFERCKCRRVVHSRKNNNYQVEQCTRPAGHQGFRHNWRGSKVGPEHATATEANRWLAENGGGFVS